ncbi:bacteriocin immunity protein [uncultured Lactobacillus sp.]|uniref:bacteriocin immunity protein n=1 Tax=uncultured Lactobacillus sp. TaxID=153152 RepID=UPI0025E35C40|nr:bacteriocin immunity protein [uncultured Lactobacillus sp.]
MRNFFGSLFLKKQQQLIEEVYQDLDQFYQSFYSNIYNELNINKYKQIRDAIGMVMRKFDIQDHPLEYTGKLVMCIQARVVLQHLHLTTMQQKLLQDLSDKTKKINLNFVYTGRLTDMQQFSNV